MYKKTNIIELNKDWGATKLKGFLKQKENDLKQLLMHNVYETMIVDVCVSFKDVLKRLPNDIKVVEGYDNYDFKVIGVNSIGYFVTVSYKGCVFRLYYRKNKSEHLVLSYIEYKLKQKGLLCEKFPSHIISDDTVSKYYIKDLFLKNDESYIYKIYNDIQELNQKLC